MPMTADIDIKIPFPTRIKKRGWNQFIHGSATRAFQVAQDRIFELVELLNLASTPLVEKINADGMTIYPQPSYKDTGCVDLAYLTGLARKRPSSRYDHVFPTPGDIGPFFMSVAYNDQALFYTFKVCYIWSAPDIAMGEPQYNELIELQMTPKVGQDCSASTRPMPGFELDLDSGLGDAEWPSLDGGKEESDDMKAPPIQLLWAADVTAAGQEDSGRHRASKLCIEDPAVLAESSGRAVTNRLARACHKSGDWEKVSNDEKRVTWLEWAAQSRVLSKLGVPVEVQDASAKESQRVVNIRCRGSGVRPDGQPADA